MELVNFYLRHHELNTCFGQDTNISFVRLKQAVNIRLCYTALWNLVLSLKGDKLSLKKKERMISNEVFTVLVFKKNVSWRSYLTHKTVLLIRCSNRPLRPRQVKCKRKRSRNVGQHPTWLRNSFRKRIVIKGGM